MDNATPNCYHCKKPIQQPTEKCSYCGFPNGGTDVQKEIFYHQLESKKGSLKDLRNKIENARVTLWVIAGLSCLYAIINYLSRPNAEGAIIILIVHIVIGIVFLLLASYASEKPFTALILALVIYISFFLFDLIEGKGNGLMGLFLRGVVVAFLIKGAISARDAEALNKEIK